ncbi:hypothetical protein LTR17_012982 [Elasticomyces elasticus]|nr:hypothetical protein LTR17_012982 [Elasticomyces elasticus]
MAQYVDKPFARANPRCASSKLLGRYLCGKDNEVDSTPGIESEADIEAEAEKLGELLLASGSRQAKEPQDHVYTLLGIASDAASIRPDYTQPVQSVFTQVLRTVVNAQPLFLDFLQLGVLVERRPGLPSWYSDFAGERKKLSIGAFLQGRAAGNISATRFSDDGLKLTVAGWQIDQIKYVGRYIRDGAEAEHDLNAPCPPPVLHE